LRLQESNPLAFEDDLADEALEARAESRRIIGARNRIKGHEAGIVAMAGESFAHITEADEEKHDARPEALPCLRA
jgi:hypothetical protein